MTRDSHREEKLAQLPNSDDHMESSLLDEASADGSVEITVQQNGQEVATVSPISTGRSIQDFYRYDRIDRASANTPMNLREEGASKLFFYRKSGLNTPISLVVIHDEPNNGNGGDARFDFEPNSLPDGDGWVVKDDPGDAGYSRTYADWSWAPCCTDGGAYRGGFDQDIEITIDPSFNEGIGQWDVLDSDGSVAKSFDVPADPITVTVSQVNRDLEQLINEKDSKITTIRNTIPEGWESDKSQIDARAEQFLNTAREVDDDGSPDEREQYEEALTRLNDSEDLMLVATQGPLRDIIPKTGSIIIKAVLALATEGLARFARSNAKDKALEFIHNRITGASKTMKNSFTNHFPVGDVSVDDPTELGTLFDKGYFPIAKYFDDTLGKDPDIAEKYFKNVEVSGNVTGGVGVVKTDWGKEGVEVISDAYEEVKRALNTLMYKLYYFSTSGPSTFDALPDFSLPPEIESYSIDIPNWITSYISDIPDSVSLDVDLPVDQYSSALSDLEDAFSQAQPYMNIIDFSRPGVSSTGINHIMADSVDALAADTKDGRLKGDARDTRSEAAETSNEMMKKTNNVFALSFEIYGIASKGLEFLTLAAFTGLLLALSSAIVYGAEVSLLAAPFTLGSVVTLMFEVLYILGWVELIYIGAQALTLTAAVLMFQKILASSVVIVNNLPSDALEGI